MKKSTKVNPNDQSIYGDDYIAAYQLKEGEGRIERLIKYINFSKSDSILDVGCGSGYLYGIIKNKIKSYTGIDENIAFIKDSQNRYGENTKNKNFINISLKNYRKKNTSIKFDKIFLLDITEHLVDSELKETIKLCHTLLNPGGSLIIHTPNKNYFLELLKDKSIMKQTLGHVGVRNPRQYKKFLKTANFGEDHIRLKEINHYVPILKTVHIFSFIPFIGRYFKARIFIIATK